MQILHPFTGSAQQYAEEVSNPDRYRPDHCPQCPARQPLIAHGFYSRTLVEAGFDGCIQVRRYLCRSCRRTVSLGSLVSARSTLISLSSASTLEAILTLRTNGEDGELRSVSMNVGPGLRTSVRGARQVRRGGEGWSRRG